MSAQFRHFGELYRHLEASPSKGDFLHNRDGTSWKRFSKGEFLRSVHYQTLAFHENGWHAKQIAVVVSFLPLALRAPMARAHYSNG